ncbi:hypothetical protein E1B28_003533 [Marasmius oreades]|nr:uncharacterized protein E1B28_003533 [Marasmius oreades]KAG7086010.1 hypothetical protein E1B28_003533 [Marasmius oreades]
MIGVYWILITSLITLILKPSVFSTVATKVKEELEIPCIRNTSLTTLESLVACYDPYTIPEQFFNQTTYDAAQPTEAESAAWLGLVNDLLWVDGNCTDVVVPPILNQVYGVSVFTSKTNTSEETGTNTSYCVLHERKAITLQPDSPTFPFFPYSYIKGWGLFVVPSSKSPSVTRRSAVHLSAPHPQFDLKTPEQAAALFSGIGAKSLLVAGRSRESFMTPTSCVQPVSSGNSSDTTVYFVTDPAHNDKEPFVQASFRIAKWQKGQGGCPASSCAFIQMHGKGASSCPQDTMFLSSGLGNSASSVAWYTDATDRPIKRLQKNVRDMFPSFTASLPSDSNCSLTATTNVFGRYLNGIEESAVCDNASNATLATGVFVHIEQAIASRNPDAYQGWIQALSETFPVTSE